MLEPPLDEEIQLNTGCMFGEWFVFVVNVFVLDELAQVDDSYGKRTVGFSGTGAAAFLGTGRKTCCHLVRIGRIGTGTSGL